MVRAARCRGWKAGIRKVLHVRLAGSLLEMGLMRPLRYKRLSVAAVAN